MLKSMLPVSVAKTYQFSTDDGVWKITLAKDAIWLEIMGKYTTWEDFIGHLVGPYGCAFRKEYGPSFFTRIGLRYVDVIRRSRLNLGNTAWKELLNPYIAGELATPIGEVVRESTHIVIVDLNDRGDRVRMHQGLVRTTDPDEASYLIDNDFSARKEREVPMPEQSWMSLGRSQGTASAGSSLVPYTEPWNLKGLPCGEPA